MSRSHARRGVAAASAVAMVPLGLMIIGGGAATAAPAAVDWWDGSSHYTRTVDNASPAVGEVVTTSTTFERKQYTTSEIIQQVKDVHPTCLTYVEGSAKVDDTSQGVDSKGADFVKVTGSWAVYPNVSPKSRTFEFSYTVGADCARGVPLPTSMHYSGGLGSGTYDDKGPAITVAKDVTTTALAAVTGAKVGQSTQLTATVTGGAAGNVVEFYDGDARIGAGPLVGDAVSIAWTPATDGDHAVTAKFLATATASDSTSSAQTVTVSAADVATTVQAAAPTTAKVGAAVDLSVTVTPANAQGAVQFKDGDVNVGDPVTVTDGAASLSHTFDAAGAKSITAVFTGGAGFLGSTSQPVTLTVSEPLPTDVATATTLVVPATATVGATVTLAATVAPATAGGTVQFKDGDRAIGLPAAIVDGKATLPYAFPTAGAKNVTAVYSGGAGHTASTSEVGVVTVSAAPVQGGGGSLENIFGS